MPLFLIGQGTIAVSFRIHRTMVIPEIRLNFIHQRKVHLRHRALFKRIFRRGPYRVEPSCPIVRVSTKDPYAELTLTWSDQGIAYG